VLLRQSRTQRLDKQLTAPASKGHKRRRRASGNSSPNSRMDEEVPSVGLRNIQEVFVVVLLDFQAQACCTLEML
jgi:hypothetical protein